MSEMYWTTARGQGHSSSTARSYQNVKGGACCVTQELNNKVLRRRLKTTRGRSWKKAERVTKLTKRQKC
jgi:hypothetical protein